MHIVRKPPPPPPPPPKFGQGFIHHRTQDEKCKSPSHSDDKVGGEDPQRHENCSVVSCLNKESIGCSSLSTNLDCMKFVAKNCASIGNSNNDMFEKIMDCLLKPVYDKLKNGTETALNLDPMPGNLNVAGGGSSLGKASASPHLDSPILSEVHCVDTSQGNISSLPPVNNYSTSSRKEQTRLTYDLGKNQVSQGPHLYSKNSLPEEIAQIDRQHMSVYTSEGNTSSIPPVNNFSTSNGKEQPCLTDDVEEDPVSQGTHLSLDNSLSEEVAQIDGEHMRLHTSQGNTSSVPPVNNCSTSNGKEQACLTDDVEEDPVSQGPQLSLDYSLPEDVAQIDRQHMPSLDVRKHRSELFNPSFPSVTLCPIRNFASTLQSSTDSVDAVLKESISNAAKYPFGQQSLVTLVENDSNEDSVHADLSNVAEVTDSVVVVERNAQHQLYMLPDLKGSYHFTVGTPDIEGLMSAWPVTKKTTSTPLLYIPNSSNYASKDDKIVVINSDSNVPKCCVNQDLPSSKQRPLESLSLLMNKMFVAGVSDFFTFDNKKRSSKSKQKKNCNNSSGGTKRGKRRRMSSSHQASKCKAATSTQLSTLCSKGKEGTAIASKHVLKSNLMGCSQREVYVDPNALPVITMGWSTQDCTQYGSNLASVAGNVKPFIRDANLPKRIKSIIVEIVEAALRFLPGEWAFNLDKCGDEDVIKLRQSLVADFKEVLSGDRDTTHFRVEGITILIPLSIGLHKDTLNCVTEGMRSVISINCQIPIGPETIPDGEGSRLWVWLQQNGYSTSFPCSMILYSRKQVFYYCHKLARSMKLAEQDSVRMCMNWAMLSRVGAVTDYRSRVWNNSRFPSLFHMHSRKIKNSRFSGSMWTSPACYDKTVSYFLSSLLFYIHITHNIHYIYALCDMPTGILLNYNSHIH